MMNGLCLRTRRRHELRWVREEGGREGEKEGVVASRVRVCVGGNGTKSKKRTKQNKG